MEITKTQIDRLNYHLDLDSEYGLLEVTLNVRTRQLSEERMKTIFGDMASADTDEILIQNGNSLCTKDSILGRVELAYRKLSPDNVDDSLLVSKAGNIQLRPDEYKARKKLYKEMVNELKRATGYADLSTPRANLDI